MTAPTIDDDPQPDPEVDADAGLTPEWTMDGYLNDLEETYGKKNLTLLLKHPAGRRALTERDPLLFAILYLRDHIQAQDNTVSMCQAHLDFCDRATEWADTPTYKLEPQQSRHAYICPRELGKTSWWFLIIPMWAAAHQHARFIAAFADTAEQAQLHLSTFRKELDENPLLQKDYPALTIPAQRAGTGKSVADRQYLYIATSGFIFSARGAETSVRGLKYGKLRPDVLLFDDIEPDETKYNAKMAEERKNTLIENMFPLNIRARVIMTGTTTMYGSVIHQITRNDPWVKEQNIQAHHYLPVQTHTDKTTNKQEQRSLWPQKWSLQWLLRNMKFRWFRKEYLNEPLSDEGIYWTPDMFKRPPEEFQFTHAILTVDPAVTSTDRSDYSAVATVQYDQNTDRFHVTSAWHGRVTPEQLRQRVLNTIATHPETTAAIVEINQGGDLWAAALNNLPVKLLPTSQTAPKKTRAAMALREYEVENVFHAPALNELEGEMCSFPGLNDDLVDAVSMAILEIRARTNTPPGGSTIIAGKSSYLPPPTGHKST